MKESLEDLTELTQPPEDEENGKMETIVFFQDLLTMIGEMAAGHKKQLIEQGFEPDNAEIAALVAHDALIEHFLG